MRETHMRQNPPLRAKPNGLRGQKKQHSVLEFCAVGSFCPPSLPLSLATAPPPDTCVCVYVRAQNGGVEMWGDLNKVGNGTARFSVHEFVEV